MVSDFEGDRLHLSYLSPPPKVKEVMFSPLSVCFAVCLCTWYFRKLWTDLDEIWWRGWVCEKDDFGEDPDWRIFFK